MKKRQLNYMCWFILVFVIGCQQDNLPPQPIQSTLETMEAGHNVNEPLPTHTSDMVIMEEPLSMVFADQIGNCGVTLALYGRLPILGNPTFAWSPSGDQIAFTTRNNGELYVSDIASMTNVLQNRRKQVTDLEIGGRIAWASDGQRLAVLVKNGRYANIYVVNTVTQNYNRLTDNRSILSIDQIKWTLDGENIIFNTMHYADLSSTSGMPLTIARGNQQIGINFSFP